MQAALEWYEIAVRIGAAALLGGLLGMERGATGHEAGLRTHVLVSVGSALFAVASIGAFDSFLTDRAGTNVNVDVTRMAAYVAPGIGFIGAGVIVKHARARGAPFVSGLTTAGSLWAVAAIGVATGLGFWAGAITATLASLAVLVLARPLSAALERRHREGSLTVLELEVEVDPDSGIDDLQVMEAVKALAGRWSRLDRVSIERDAVPARVLVVSRLDPRHPEHLPALLGAVAAVARVRSLDVSSA